RTLQRIEAGDTEPRGNTLRLIAQALDTPIEELLDFTKAADPGFLQLMNLATLSFWVIPLGNLFVPLILWVMKRDKVKGVYELGRRIINFQITWCFITYGFVFSWIVSLFGRSPFIMSPFLFLPIILSLYLANSLIILMASWQIRRSRETVYSISFPILP
ncbi:MAG: transcriptional regulator, family, partial [Spirosoma sp.]|nr:transcriptional regulator, family [Spirosoma sp.]